MSRFLSCVARVLFCGICCLPSKICIKMPLVLMCGYPSSGKTKRCKQLELYLKEKYPGVKVTVVGDESLRIDKNDVYSDSKNEKSVRGSLKSEVDRNLTKEAIVILDSLNYIKGYRYELFCMCKYARTTHCLIHTDASSDTVTKWNEGRPVAEKYEQDLIGALCMRFEAPNSQNRWDSPLFTIQAEDELPGENICDALFHRKVSKPNMSAQNPPLRQTDFLYEVGQKTQEIVSAILASQKTMAFGDTATMPGTNEKYIIQHTLTLSQLRRFRQQFINYVKAMTTTKVDDIPKTFILFLNKCVETC